MIKVIMPQLSLSMQTGTVTKWLLKEGEAVKKGAPICEIEGDKAITEIVAPGDGFLLKIIANEMEEFPVKETMALIGEEGEAFKETPSVDMKNPRHISHPAPKTETLPAIKSRERISSPAARRMAEELGVDISTVIGSGPDGLINKVDVLLAKEKMEKGGIKPTPASHITASSPAVLTKIPLSGIKKLAGKRIKESYLEAPHIELILTVNMRKALDLRAEINSTMDDRQHITLTDLFIWAVSQTIKDHPLINAKIIDDDIVEFSDINIGFAAVSDQGLIVPVVRNADRLTMIEIAQHRQKLVSDVRSGNHKADDLSGGTFTITNLGMYGIEVFKPIITLGQSAILGIGEVKNTPVTDDSGKVIVQPLVTLCLACDHRVVDGVDGAKYLRDLKEKIEDIQAISSK